MSKDNGGPAFPQGKGAGDVWVTDGGMTLRDYFATVVDKDEYGELLYKHVTHDMAVSLAGPKPASKGIDELDWHMKVRAAIRYRMADAMIAERSK